MCASTERVVLHLPVSDTSPSAARRAVRASACLAHDLHVLDDALLLTSELVTNSVRHGGPPISVVIDCHETCLRVSVSDGSAVVPRPRQAGADDEDSRGLALVDLLAYRWGVDEVHHRRSDGKAIWFELRAPR